jgi:transposase
LSSSIQASEVVGDPASDPPRDPAGEVVDPAPRPVRRSFTAEYRAQVVAEYEAAPYGEKSAVLRREGLYQSQIRDWAYARDALAREAAAPRRPHRAVGSSGGKHESDRLRAENSRLASELAKSQAVVEVMGKFQGLLEILSESTGTPLPPAR